MHTLIAHRPGGSGVIANVKPRMVVASLLLVACVAATSSSAAAGTFSRPVRPPSGHGYIIPWLLAINDRRQAVASTGNLVYEIARSRKLSRPWRMTTPDGHFGPSVGSIALDDRGRIAVGMVYSDETDIPEDLAHNYICCSHVAVASWRLGATPPAGQVLSPQRPRNV
jgi:hypothetical protein